MLVFLERVSLDVLNLVYCCIFYFLTVALDLYTETAGNMILTTCLYFCILRFTYFDYWNTYLYSHLVYSFDLKRFLPYLLFGILKYVK